MASLSPSELEQYSVNGYLVPEYRLPEARGAELRAALDRVISANPDTRPEQLVSAHIKNPSTEGVAGDDAFLDLARDDEIVDLVSQLIGPDVILWGCQIFCKPVGVGMDVHWHQY